jgi:RNA polymerase sigma-70 factor (ECF subfamily)
MTTNSAGLETLEIVFLRDRQRLLGFVRRAGAGDEAEDILHEAWLKIEGLKDRPLPDQPIAYLYRVLHNLMLDRRRGARRAVRRDAEWADIAGPETAGVSDEPGIDHRMIASEEFRAAQAAVEALGEPTATIFRRHRIDGVTQREIAADLALAISTVEKHLRKAYAAMIAWRGARDDD